MVRVRVRMQIKFLWLLVVLHMHHVPIVWRHRADRSQTCKITSSLLYYNYTALGSLVPRLYLGRAAALGTRLISPRL